MQGEHHHLEIRALHRTFHDIRRSDEKHLAKNSLRHLPLRDMFAWVHSGSARQEQGRAFDQIASQLSTNLTLQQRLLSLITFKVPVLESANVQELYTHSWHDLIDRHQQLLDKRLVSLGKFSPEATLDESLSETTDIRILQTSLLNLMREDQTLSLQVADCMVGQLAFMTYLQIPLEQEEGKQSKLKFSYAHQKHLAAKMGEFLEHAYQTDDLFHLQSTCAQIVNIKKYAEHNKPEP